MSNRGLWTKDMEAVMRERYTTDGPAVLAQEFGLTNRQVVVKANKMHLPRFLQRWTEEMDTRLREVYPTAEPELLLKEFPGYALSAIRSHARNIGVRCTRAVEFASAGKVAANKSCNIHFFDEWSPGMAYATGFIFADGSVTKRGSDIVIAVAEKDISVLEYLKKITESNRVLRIEDNRNKPGNYSKQRSVWFTLGSRRIVERLAELGLHHRKTYNDDPFPTVPDEMFPHFVRGYFDGDGTAFVSCQDYCRIGLIGTPKFLTGMRDGLVRLAGMKENPVKSDGDDDVCYRRVWWGAKADVIRFRDFIYPRNYSFCLERKKAVIDTWLEQHQ